MIKQIGIDILGSFSAWFDHVLLNKGQAFDNYSGLFYKSSDPKIPSNTAKYYSPFRQFVYDQSVSGAVIQSGIYINNVFAPRGTSGVGIDYLNGAVYTNSMGSPVISGNYSIKEFNIYSTTKSEEELVFETKYHFVNKSQVTQNYSGLPPDKVVAPCIFITNPNQNNSMEVLGGETYKKELNMRAVVVAPDDYALQNVGSFFTDRAFSCFGLIDSRALNVSGDYNNGTAYNYTGLLSNVPLAYINNVFFTKFTASAENSVSDNAKIGFLEFEIEYSRAVDRTI